GRGGIRSVAGSLEGMMKRAPGAPEWEEDMKRGLAVIGGRAEALSRFMEAYSRLAKLPPPQLQTVSVGQLVERVAKLETRVEVKRVPGPPLSVRADRDQLEQLLINLLRNAADAALETGGTVQIGWFRPKGPSTYLELFVDDEGPGLPNTGNLFVPFFTTKPQGSGIGLVLSRQIAEAHGGALTLDNRTDRRGCRAVLRLPR